MEQIWITSVFKMDVIKAYNYTNFDFFNVNHLRKSETLKPTNVFKT